MTSVNKSYQEIFLIISKQRRRKIILQLVKGILYFAGAIFLSVCLGFIASHESRRYNPRN